MVLIINKMSQELFDKAAQACTDYGKSGGSMSNDQALAIYCRFKQATVGDVNTDRPGLFDQKGRAKWDAWSAIKGKSKEEAMTEYIDLAKQYVSEEFASRIA